MEKIVISNTNAFYVLSKMITQKEKVDLIILDLPYGQTHNHWDIKINLPLLWECLTKIRRSDKTPILFFASGMRFVAELIASKPNWYRYDIVWDKVHPTKFLDAGVRPLAQHEFVLVFIEKHFDLVDSQDSYKQKDKVANYWPQKVKGKKNHSRGTMLNTNLGTTYASYTKTHFAPSNESDLKHPKDIVQFRASDIITFAKEKRTKTTKPHPTSKPIALYEWLIKSYSKLGDTIFDGFIGGGNIINAVYNTNRSLVGSELDFTYWNDYSVMRLGELSADLECEFEVDDGVATLQYGRNEHNEK